MDTSNYGRAMLADVWPGTISRFQGILSMVRIISRGVPLWQSGEIHSMTDAVTQEHDMQSIKRMLAKAVVES